MKNIFSLLLILIFSFVVFSQTATIIADNANLRGTSKQDGKVITTAANGSDVEIIKQTGGRFLVRTIDYVGWLHGNTIKISNGIAVSNDAPTTRISIEAEPKPQRTQTSRNYIRVPRGSCHYINSNGSKTYVDRSFCI